MGSNKKSIKTQKPKHPGGRPTKFTDALQAKIIELAESGRTIDEIAEIVGVHSTTLYMWQREKPEFLWSIKEAKCIADELVEASLFRRAIGCSIPEKKVFMDKNGNVVEHMTEAYYPPSDVAAIFWLKNRKPEQWREKQPETDESNKNEVTEIVLKWPDEADS